MEEDLEQLKQAFTKTDQRAEQLLGQFLEQLVTMKEGIQHDIKRLSVERAKKLEKRAAEIKAKKAAEKLRAERLGFTEDDDASIGSRLSKRVSSLEAQLRTKSREIASMKVTLEEAKHSGEAQRIKDLELELKQVKKEQEQASFEWLFEREQLESTIKHLQADVDEVSAQIAPVTHGGSTAAQEMRRVEEEVAKRVAAALEEQLGELKHRLEVVVEEKHQLDLDKEALQTELKNREQEAEESQARHAELLAEHEEGLSRLGDLEHTLEHKNLELDQLR